MPVAKFDHLFFLQILLLMFKCRYLTYLVSSVCGNYFVLNNEIHNYDPGTISTRRVQNTSAKAGHLVCI